MLRSHAHLFWISSGSVYKSRFTIPTWSSVSQSSLLSTLFCLDGTTGSLGVGILQLLSNVDCNSWSRMSKVSSSYIWTASGVLTGKANILGSSVRGVGYTSVSVVLGFGSSGISLGGPLWISCVLLILGGECLKVCMGGTFTVWNTQHLGGLVLR